MSAVPYRVRVIRGQDAPALRSFRCANASVDWQLEVEQFIRDGLIYWIHAPGAQTDDPRGLLLSDDATDHPVGVVAHQRADLLFDGLVLPARQIYVAALALDWQGKRFANGDRASDAIMTAAMTDIVSRSDRHERIHAIVHRENVRSQSLCRRHGMTDQLDFGIGEYLRLATPSMPGARSPD